MFSQERYQKIVSYINERERVTVSEMASILSVSVDTIRRDFKHLEKEQLIIRTHGGAMMLEENRSIDVKTRMMLASKEKDQIAKKMFEHIDDYDVLFLDGSSSTIFMLPLLADKKHLTIVTNSVHTASAVLDAGLEVELHMIGGKVHKNSKSVVNGTNMQAFRISKAIMSCCSFVIGQGFLDLDYDEAIFKKEIIGRSQLTFFLMDHNKFNKKAPMVICDMSEGMRIISDDQLSLEIKDRFTEKYEQVIE